MAAKRFDFASANFAKILRIPLYFVGLVLSFLLPRKKNLWVFGSHAGLGEGALPIAKELQNIISSRSKQTSLSANYKHSEIAKFLLVEPGLNTERIAPEALIPFFADAEIVWLAATEKEKLEATNLGFVSVLRNSFQGFLHTLRARQIIVTHGLGDVNRYGVFRANIVQLWHGAPLKKINLDSLATTALTGKANVSLVQKILKRMYRVAASEIKLYAAGSATAANRLRSAFAVPAGKVQILGDARHDPLFQILADKSLQTTAKEKILHAAGLPRNEFIDKTLLLYAPTWRDGQADPTNFDKQTVQQLKQFLKQTNAVLMIRSHPMGFGSYDELLQHQEFAFLPAQALRDITAYLPVFEALITDYSSLAVDFSVCAKPIVWFAPDIEEYSRARGLYEPLEVTSEGRYCTSWIAVAEQLNDVLQPESIARKSALRTSAKLAARFHHYQDGQSSLRVLAAIAQLQCSDAQLVSGDAVYFESFYGRQTADNPLALDAEIAKRLPDLERLWCVQQENQAVPAAAVAVIYGSRLWWAARAQAQTLVVNDWLNDGPKLKKRQKVVQTWHGTMLKNLALLRPDKSLRRTIAVKRQSRKWDLTLSQNAHTTAHLRKAYAIKKDIFESGYPRCDKLARSWVSPKLGSSLAADIRLINPVIKSQKKNILRLTAAHIVLYAPTWRETAEATTLRVQELAAKLGKNWQILVRGHSRETRSLLDLNSCGQIIDVSAYPDINDLLLASDVLITDYSSIMFDASVIGLPQIFYVPDLEVYKDEERGFAFDFENTSPGPLCTSIAAVEKCLQEFARNGYHSQWLLEHSERLRNWQLQYNPCDDGQAASRVVDYMLKNDLLKDPDFIHVNDLAQLSSG